MILASPAILPSGAWGARPSRPVKPGDLVEVVTRGGRRWPARVTRVLGDLVETDRNVAAASAANDGPRDTPAPPSASALDSVPTVPAAVLAAARGIVAQAEVDPTADPGLVDAARGILACVEWCAARGHTLAPLPAAEPAQGAGADLVDEILDRAAPAPAPAAEPTRAAKPAKPAKPAKKAPIDWAAIVDGDGD